MKITTYKVKNSKPKIANFSKLENEEANSNDKLSQTIQNIVALLKTNKHLVMETYQFAPPLRHKNPNLLPIFSKEKICFCVTIINQLICYIGCCIFFYFIGGK